MKTLDRLKRYIPALLRIPLGLIFFFFGMEKLFAPQATLAIIQGSILAPLFSQSNAIIYLIGTVETIVGIFLILNIQIRTTALLAALLLIPIIVIAQIPQDIVLFFVAITLSILGKGNPWRKSST